MADLFSHQIKDSEEKYYLTAALPEFRSASQRFFPFPMAVSLEKEPDLLYLATLSRRLSRPGDMWACMLRYVDLRLAARRTVDAAAYELWDQAFCAVTEPRRRDLAFLKPVIRRLERHFNGDHATGSSVRSSPSVEGGSVSGGSVSGESVFGGSVAGGGDDGGGDGRRGGSRNQGNSNSATPVAVVLGKLHAVIKATDGVGDELERICFETLRRLDQLAKLPGGTDAAKVANSKLRGDALRHLSLSGYELSKGRSITRRMTKAYQAATRHARWKLVPVDPLRMNLAINYSIALATVNGDYDGARQISKLAFEEAVEMVSGLGEGPYQVRRQGARTAASVRFKSCEILTCGGSLK